MPRRRPPLALPFLLLLPAALPAQALPPDDPARVAAMAAIPAGAVLRIRVRASGTAPFTGRLVERAEGGLVVVFGRDTLLVRDADVQVLERMTHLRSRGTATAIGAGKGLLFGAAVGSVATGIVHLRERRTGCPDCMISATMATAFLGAVFTGVSTVVGGVVGHSRREQWRREWPPAR